MRIQTAPLTKQEFLGLMRMSQREARTPNEQLRYLVRRALFGDESPPTDAHQKKNTASAKASQANANGVVANP